jgi:glycosyltransferase involved in cell wall biosynthesis
MTHVRRRIAFIVTEDWFFVSHFLPMLRAAVDLGLEVIVVTRTGTHAKRIEELGARVVPLNIERGHFGLKSLCISIVQLAQILRREKIDIVHCIAIRSVVTGGLAANLAGVKGRVMAITGGGLLAADKSAKAAVGRSVLHGLLRVIRIQGRNHFLFENVTDPVTFGLSSAHSAVTVLGGAGVDPDFYSRLPVPSGSGLKLAMISRMVWSKGADIAVEAVSIARARGYEVSLSLFGLPDTSNPRSLTKATLREWSRRPGVEWRGVAIDVREVWAEHDCACLPTRGGEGLPRSILEAAACGRAILTTDVPGCRDFVRDGVEGWLLPAGDTNALADRICALSQDKISVINAGINARSRVEQGFTEEHVVKAVQRVYKNVLGGVYNHST